MPKVTLQDVTSGYNTSEIINDNNAAIEAAFDNTLSLDGSTPNAMEAALDMNGHQVLNVGAPTSNNSAARWVDVQDAVALVGTPVPSQSGQGGKVLGTDGSALGWYNYRDSISGVLSTEAVVVPCDASGNVLDYTACQGTFTLYMGVDAVNPALVSFSTGANPQSLVASINSSGQYSVTSGLDAGEAYGEITFTATYQGTTVSRKMTIGKAIQGAAGPTGGAADILQGYLTATNYLILVGQNNEPLTGSFTGANGRVRLFENGIEVTALASYSVVAAGCTGTINTDVDTPISGQPRGYFQVTAMSADTGTLSITATYNSRNFYGVYTVTKARVGYSIVDTLPVSGTYEGEMVYLTTDNKLYRWDGTNWITAVAASDLTGQLTSDQINSITAAQITGSIIASQIGSVNASAVTGLLTDSQIQSLAATKIAGQLTDSQLAEIAAAKVTGQLSASQIASIASTQITGQLNAAQINSLTTAQLTGQISSTQIADDAITTPKIAAGAVTAAEIAANTITAGQLAAGSVTTSQLAAGSVTTAALAAGAVTADTIATNAITTPKIEAGAIVAGKLAADSVLAANIAAGQITTPKLAAGAVTSNEIAAATIVAGNIASATITSGQIASGTITTGNLAAGAVTTPILAAGAVTANEIAAATITTDKIQAGAITAATIASSAVTTAKIAAGAVTANEIAAGSITGDRIAAGTITATQIAAGAVDASTLAAGSITSDKIAANAITVDKIQAGTITADRIVAGTLDTDTLAPGAVTETDIGIQGLDITAASTTWVELTNVATSSLTAGLQVFLYCDVKYTPNVGTSNLYIRLLQNGTPIKTFHRQIVPTGADFITLNRPVISVSGVNTFSVEVQTQYSGSATTWSEASLSYVVIKR